ncbi:MAG: hypothetical protein FD141_340 [Fusobacteria bacterium]|nr:MAG: hypothetical protein FD141_340 [Fusobacteriota bacterium]KAF0228995.1 MAG: hypothetical protein FD182_1251 [Fusobacteriota bacterium]
MIMKKVILGTIIATGLLIPAGVLMATEANTYRNDNRQQEVVRQQEQQADCTGDCTMENKNSGQKRGNGACDGTGTRTMQRLQDGSCENCDGTCINE